MADSTKSFWDHLDDLRDCIVKMLIASLLAGVALFAFKEPLFNVVLAPKNSDFITYQCFAKLLAQLGIDTTEELTFHVDLINTQLASQFMIHLKVAFLIGFVLVLPYLLYQLFQFLAPALYQHERKYALSITVCGYVLFIIGALLSYFLIFPLTFRFLGTYQVSEEIVNTINLESYIDTFFLLCAMMGILFEIPILAWAMAKLGVLTASMMRDYRKHAIVGTLILAAVITPTGDGITLLLVSLPIYLLYEISIWIVRFSQK